MISGLQVREAVPADLSVIKSLVDKSRNELGFVPLPALARTLERGWLFVAEVSGEVIGATDWWTRRDRVVVLYNMVVDSACRKRGVGQGLLRALVDWARVRDMREIRLKCPHELPSNGFYRKAGFALSGCEPGKRRLLNCWVLDLQPTTHEVPA